jgi:hypothetical protein
MKPRIVRTSSQGPGGQILVLAALLMVILIGITGLAIDVSAAYVADRWQRSVADAASLAGGQDLQTPGSRALPTDPDRLRARSHAMDVLVSELGATSTPSTAVGSPCLAPGGCPLPGTPYVVAIRTPSPSYVDCIPDSPQGASRCIQVSVRQPAFGLTFGRIFGQNNWTVNATSVAGVVQARQYGIVTLRPPDPRGGTQNQKDLFVTGGSKVVVGQADVATNTNLVCSGIDSEVQLDLPDGFAVYHFDPTPAWFTGSGRCLNPPPNVPLTSPVDDPKYPIPQRVAATPTFLTEADAIDSSSNCAAQQLLIPEEYKELATNQKLNDPAVATVTCFKPGIYKFTLEAKDPSSGLPNAVLLEPGVYFFDYGVRVQSSLIGGFVRESPGVALVFKEAKNSSGDPGQFTTTNNTSLLALNMGDAYCPGPAGTVCPAGRKWASPAESPNPAGGPPVLVQTPAPNSVLLSVMVLPDPTCLVGTTAPQPPNCKETENKTLSLTGGGNIFLAGVQYAPSDNATLTGNAGQKAEIGAFWSWTVEFKGGTAFNLASSIPEKAGVLRLDLACSPSVSVCNP